MGAKRILSGIQPTGKLHIGNYIGAVKQWLALQAEPDTENFFCIVDLHAMTVDFTPEALRESVYATAAAYVAAGIDPETSCIFCQSSVPEHSELQWILSCMTPMGWLNRMTQFKEKAGKDKQQSMLGLYSYPVLMAADILLYRTTHVPVGEDQKQHIELARDIAESVNARFGAEIFVLPEPYIRAAAPRVMSLRDGTKKMSKSESSDNSRINLTDSDDEIRRKISKAKTDAIAGIFSADDRPEITNLLRLFSAVTGESAGATEARYRHAETSAFKRDLADAVIADIAPVRDEMARLLKDDRSAVRDMLQSGGEKAQTVAAQTIKAVKEATGLSIY